MLYSKSHEGYCSLSFAFRNFLAKSLAILPQIAVSITFQRFFQRQYQQAIITTMCSSFCIVSFWIICDIAPAKFEPKGHKDTYIDICTKMEFVYQKHSDVSWRGHTRNKDHGIKIADFKTEFVRFNCDHLITHSQQARKQQCQENLQKSVRLVHSVNISTSGNDFGPV